MIVLDLPLGPSTNNLFGHRPGQPGRFPTARYKTWLQAAGWDVQAAQARKIEGDVAVCIHIPFDYRADADNRIKAPLDLLVRHGLIDDDRHVIDLRVVKDRTIDKARCRVEVRSAEPQRASA